MKHHSPTDAPELVAVLADAAAARRRVRLHAGTSKSNWCVPSAEADVLDVSNLRGVIDYQPTELILAARAATPLSEVEAALNTHGQMLAFEPPDWRVLLGTSDRDQTLGGIVACNLSGPRRVTAGAARDHLLGVQAVSGRAEAFKAGGKVVKNVTGYDLCKILAGSYGTLAVFTELVMKVMPRPECSVSAVRSGLSDDDAVRLMIDALNSGHDVSAAAHLPANVAGDGRALTVLRVEGTRASVKARQEALRKELSCDLLEESVSNECWGRIRDLMPLIEPSGPVWRIAVPATCASRVAATIAQSLPCRWFYDWGGALIWLCVDESVADGGAQIIRTAIAAVGHAVLLRASSELRASVDTFQPMLAPLTALNDRVKQAFDPAGILNPRGSTRAQ